MIAILLKVPHLHVGNHPVREPTHEQRDIFCFYNLLYNQFLKRIAQVQIQHFDRCFALNVKVSKIKIWIHVLGIVHLHLKTHKLNVPLTDGVDLFHHLPFQSMKGI